jgi:amino acid adenylation domain-containing protein
LFLAQALRSPGTVALVVGRRSLTYGELERASAELAGRLRAHGAGPGSTICLHLHQSAQTVIGMLAALRIGAGWVVIEPDHPASRLRTLLADVDRVVVVRSGEPAAEYPVWTEVVDVDAVGETSVQVVPVSAQAPAYLVFTSGSTGTPKAVVVSREQLAMTVAARDVWCRPGRPVFLLVMSMSFDGAIGDLFWTLGQGGTTVFPDRDQLPNPVEVARLAATHGASHTFVVPSFYRLLLDHADDLASLAVAVVGGEACTAELARRHRETLPHTELFNIYGPTETVVSCTVQRVDTSAPTVPIGKPCPGARAHVLDERLRPTPDGEIGELYISGFVAMGYAARPALTAERFVADPAGRRGARMYRTGDLASVNDRGELEFHGRVDHQVKIRGSRVELGEVEHVLEDHPVVRQAVVVARDARLVAFLVPEPGVEWPSTLKLRDFCREHLMDQAIPERFERIERLPVTATGKADRTALAQRIPHEPGPCGPDRPRWSAVQVAVADAWAAVLGHAECDLDDNFFVVGGTSLKLIDLYERLDERWPGAIEIAELFDLVTIGKQAEAVVRGAGAGEPARSGTRRDFEV